MDHLEDASHQILKKINGQKVHHGAAQFTVLMLAIVIRFQLCNVVSDHALLSFFQSQKNIMSCIDIWPLPVQNNRYGIPFSANGMSFLVLLARLNTYTLTYTK